MRRLILALALVASIAHAGVEKVGTTSAAFLKLGSGARPAALGEAYVALADDAGGVIYNPAGMSQLLASEVQATHTEWFRGLRFESINAVVSLGDGGMLGTTFNFLSVPTLTRTEQIANTSDPALNFKEIGNFTPFDMMGAVSYSRPLWKNILGGATFKLLSQNIDDRSTFGIGLDLGMIWKTPLEGMNFGFAAQNLGTPIKLKREAFELPTLLRTGLGYKPFGEKALFLLEVDVPFDNALVVSTGAEYNFADRFFPRIGWRFNSIFNPWSAGLGLKYLQWGVDLSLVPFGELGMTYRGTVTYRWGHPSAALEARSAYLSNREGGKPAVLTPIVTSPDKISSWGLFIYDSGRPAKIVRKLQGQGAVGGEKLWDGKLDDGSMALEGTYHAVLSVRYNTGRAAFSKYVRLELNNAVPVVDLSLDPSSINPLAPNEAYVPTALRPALKSGKGVTQWRVEILDPQGAIFRTYQGDGDLPASVVWDGKNDKGEALVSTWVYQARLWVKDALGNEGLSPTPVSFKAVFR